MRLQPSKAPVYGISSDNTPRLHIVHARRTDYHPYRDDSWTNIVYLHCCEGWQTVQDLRSLLPCAPTNIATSLHFLHRSGYVQRQERSDGYGGGRYYEYKAV